MRLAACVLSLALVSNPWAMPAQEPAPAWQSATAKDVAELSSYALTMDIVTRLFQATHAATEAAKADPSIKVSLGSDEGASPTIDQLANKLATSPKLVAILAENGFTPHAYSAASFSLIQTGLAMIAMQGGQSLEQVSRAAHVNPANIKLLAEHKAEMQALQAKYPTQ